MSFIVGLALLGAGLGALAWTRRHPSESFPPARPEQPPIVLLPPPPPAPDPPRQPVLPSSRKADPAADGPKINSGKMDHPAVDAAPKLARKRAASSSAPRVRQDGPDITSMRTNILDKLESYQRYIKRMRKVDPDSYKVYRRVGAYILPEGISMEATRLEPAIVAKMPAFGAVAMTEKRTALDGRHVHIKFIYFTKFTKPGSRIERVSQGVVYRMAAYWDDTENKDLEKRACGLFGEFAVHVMPDGTVRPLRVLKNQEQVIRHRDGQASTISHQLWGLPEFGEPPPDMPIAQQLSRVFTLIMNAWILGAHGSMVRVTATKSGVVMPFVIDPLVMTNFFRDREKITGPTGRTKQMFHMVRTHMRGENGVKMHFRGVRDFVWNSYAINITVPGKFHYDIADMDLGVLSFEDDEEAPWDTEEMSTLADTVVADMIGSPKLPLQAAASP